MSMSCHGIKIAFGKKWRLTWCLFVNLQRKWFATWSQFTLAVTTICWKIYLLEQVLQYYIHVHLGSRPDLRRSALCFEGLIVAVVDLWHTWLLLKNNWKKDADVWNCSIQWFQKSDLELDNTVCDTTDLFPRTGARSVTGTCRLRSKVMFIQHQRMRQLILEKRWPFTD